MKKTFFFYLLFIFFFNALVFGDYKKGLDSVTVLLKAKEYDLAKDLLVELKNHHDTNGDLTWLTKSNLELAKIYNQQKDFGKAVIYNLEAIRYAKQADYEGVFKDLALIHNRCGMIFGKFKAYDLAEEYYGLGIDYMDKTEAEDIRLVLNYNLAGLHSSRKRYKSSIEILERLAQQVDESNKYYYNIHNRLAIVYRNSGRYEDAIKTYETLLSQLDSKDIKRKGYYTHNLARTYRLSGNVQDAEKFYKQAVEIKKLNKNEKSLFGSYFGLGQTYLELGELQESSKYFKEAEQLISMQPDHPDYFELYKYCADLNHMLQNYDLSKHYENLYSDRINQYLAIQSEIQETDQRYNMDLITKRYFDEVEEQQRIAEIMFYSKLSSGGLFILLILVIGYYQYQRVTTRKTLERELIELKLVK